MFFHVPRGLKAFNLWEKMGLQLKKHVQAIRYSQYGIGYLYLKLQETRKSIQQQFDNF